MNEEIAAKTNVFITQIRMSQRKGIIEKHRHRIQDQEKQERKNKQILETNYEAFERTQNLILQEFDSNSMKSIHALSRSCPNYIDYLPESVIEDKLGFIFNYQSLNCEEGLSIASFFIKYGRTLDCRDLKRQIIEKMISATELDENIFILLTNKIEETNLKMIESCMNCIENLAMLRVEKIRGKSLASKYLLLIIKNCMSHESTFTFLTYVSEVHILPPKIISFICEHAQSSNLIIKFSISLILNNYISIEPNEQHFCELFDPIINACSLIYIECRKDQRIALSPLEAIYKLVLKFPENRGIELLKKRSFMGKFQETAHTALIVDGESIKNIIYEIYEIVIDKTIDDLREKFFDHFNLDIVHSFVEGAQHNSPSIIFRCLKVLIKLINYAPNEVLIEIEKVNEFLSVLGNLVFHKDPKIHEMAEICIKNYEEVVIV